jgi:hypothetical protein
MGLVNAKVNITGENQEYQELSAGSLSLGITAHSSGHGGYPTGLKWNSTAMHTFESISAFANRFESIFRHLGKGGLESETIRAGTNLEALSIISWSLRN